MKKFDLHFGAVCGVALFVSAVFGLGSCSDAEGVMNSEIEGSSGCVPVRVHVSDFSFSVDDFPGTVDPSTSSGNAFGPSTSSGTAFDPSTSSGTAFGPSTGSGTAFDPSTGSGTAGSGTAGTRGAVDPGSYNGLKAMTLAFYSADGSEVSKITQEKGSAENFGDFSLTLPLGSYTMVVIGRDVLEGDVFSLTSATVAGYTSERVRETFCAKQSVAITSSAAVNLDVTLNRIVAQLTIQSTDGRPEGASKIRTTYSGGGKMFSPSTGLAIEDTGFSVVNTPKTAVGAAIGVKNFAFLASNEQVMDITLEVLDADDNVLITKEVKDVPLARNKKTTLSGALFTPTAVAIGVRVEEDWLPEETITF